MNDHNIFIAHEPLWLDALYLRRRPSTWHLFHFIDLKRNAELFATRLTIQGNGGLNTSVHYGDSGSKAIYQGTAVRLCNLSNTFASMCRRVCSIPSFCGMPMAMLREVASSEAGHCVPLQAARSMFLLTDMGAQAHAWVVHLPCCAGLTLKPWMPCSLAVFMR